jgi:predicted GTPase
VLVLLFFGPIAAYIGFGALWLAAQPGPLPVRGQWLYLATTLWILAGVAFAILGNRWTKAKRELLPPIDWDAPHTFSPFDRQAWQLVQEEADRGEAISLEALSVIDTYIETALRLARRLAAHYHPLSADPIEHVPVVDGLAALQLAAEDLATLCREIPGGDMITPAHWKRAVQAAGYLQKASDLYTYLLPIFQPVTGLVRLGTQKLMVQPAWKNMQQNLMRWFYRAFVNRLGTHLIELYSGRLAIGAEQYRRLTRRGTKTAPIEDVPPALVMAGAGGKDAGKTRLIEAIAHVVASGDLAPVRARLAAAGLGEELVARLKAAQWIEVPSYTGRGGAESARDRATRREAVEEAVEGDLLVLVHDMARDDAGADARFLEAWSAWYAANPGLEVPPVLAVVTGADRPELGDGWHPPYDWQRGRGGREAAVRARIEALRAALGATLADVVPVGLGSEPPYGVAEVFLPTLAPLLHRAERGALIRHLRRASARSKARRLMTQVGRQGRRLFESIKSARRASRATGEAQRGSHVNP